MLYNHILRETCSSVLLTTFVRTSQFASQVVVKISDRNSYESPILFSMLVATMISRLARN